MTGLCEKLPRVKHVREDGWLAELVSKAYNDEPFDCVHSYVVSVEPGCSRAGHVHNKKREWFATASGKLELVLEDPKTKQSERVLMDAEAEDFNVYYVAPGVAHVFKNPSDTEKALLVVFSQNTEDKADTVDYEFGSLEAK